MTHSVVGSLIIAAMIMQGRELWQELYGPEREASEWLTRLREIKPVAAD